MKIRHLTKTLVIVMLILGISCEEESSGGEENTNPGSFTVTVSDVMSTTATIRWSAPTDIDDDVLTYDVVLASSPVVSGQSELFYEFSNLVADTEYDGVVVAQDGNGGQSSASFTFTTEEVAGSAPTSFNVSVSEISHNSASLSWTTSVDPDGGTVTYAVELGTDKLVDSQSGTTFELTSLTSGEELSGKVIASDSDNATTEATFSLTSYVIDITKYSSMPGFSSATLVDCDYSEGGAGQCYRIVFSSNNIDDDGPFCPETTSDVGGFGNYNGDGLANGSPTDGEEYGFSPMNAALFEAMENDGYDIIDGMGNIRVSDFSGTVNPNFGYCLEPLPDDELTLTFEIPVVPSALSSADNIETVEYIGLALDGVPINGAPPTVAGSGAQGEGKIPSLDRCGGHHDPSGYYHWHFIAAHMDKTLDANGFLDPDNDIQCSKKTQDATALVGYARDGYPIYSGEDADGLPVDLDDCNGHVSATAEYPDGVYHYHASTDITNVPPCIVGKQSRNSFDKPQ